jgi:hypothetical protein
VPILGGGRLTGKVGSFDVGAINIQTDDLSSIGRRESTNFTVLRAAARHPGALERRRALREPLPLARRDGEQSGLRRRRQLLVLEDLNLVGYFATTRTEGLSGSDDSYQRRTASYNGDLIGRRSATSSSGEDFNPEIGFVRRRGFDRLSSAAATARARSIEWIRQLRFQARHRLPREPPGGFVETREWGQLPGGDGEQRPVQRRLHGDVREPDATSSTSRRTSPFRRTLLVPRRAGQLQLRAPAPYSGNLSVRRGSFYGGTRTSVGFQRARVEVLPQLSLEPSLSFNWVDLGPLGDFTQHVATRA